jgi:hypothetical protein
MGQFDHWIGLEPLNKVGLPKLNDKPNHEPPINWDRKNPPGGTPVRKKPKPKSPSGGAAATLVRK